MAKPSKILRQPPQSASSNPEFDNSHYPTPVHALIVAAGRGSRFGSDVPKQYVLINNKTILEHSVDALAANRHIESLCLVIAKADEVAQSLSFDLPVSFAIGGAERWESVKAGVSQLIAVGGQAQDLVLIHDAARPCVQSEHIDAVIDVASQEPYGAILGVPVVDTIKKVQMQVGETKTSPSSPVITKTVDRSQLWQAQTPQVFRLRYLAQVLDEVANQGLTITDEASAFEMLGYPIRIVAGSSHNMKLTYQEDLNLIKMILASRESLTLDK